MMKKVIASTIVVLACLGAVAQSSVRERELFNADWRFTKNDPDDILLKDTSGKGMKSALDYKETKDWFCSNGSLFARPSDSVQVAKRPKGNPGGNISYAAPRFNDNSWRSVTLPHDWGVEGPFNINLPGETGKLPWVGAGWYRKHFTVPAINKAKRFFLDIDGAMAYPMVWLNGKYVGGWAYGYNSFRVDLTPFLKVGGDNVVAIRVFNPANSSRWYPGSGIYRNVWLVTTNPVHVGQWGTYITTPKVDEKASALHLKVTIDNQSLADAKVSIKTQVYLLGNNDRLTGIPLASFSSVEGKVVKGASQTFSADATIRNPILWSTETPQRYVAITNVMQDGKVVDTYETPFGIRTLEYSPEKGFLLNGKHVQLKGVCNHHDLGALGAAFNTRAAERQLEILKEMGFNALRTSHNMPAPELLDLCDKMGILVMDESFDCWHKGKTPNDYSNLFDDWSARDLRAEVDRDRNHPSIIMWSIGNELPDLNTPEGPAIAARLTAYVKGEDPTRATVFGSNSSKAMNNGLEKGVDIYGQNYLVQNYTKFKKLNPNQPFVGSETSSTVSSRGEYYFPVTNNINDSKGLFQVSSYDLYYPRWATTPEAEFKALEENPFVMGEFVWTGFDYLGEPTPFNSDVTNLLNFSSKEEKDRMDKELKELGKIKSPSRSSYFGIVDLCGFKKDRFYLYQSMWKPELPMAHILPHWNWPNRVGLVTPVHVYTSGDEAELFLNGVSLGRKKKAQYEYRLRWDSVVYQPGELKVVAYRNGAKWAEDVVKTTGEASALTLSPDRATITADGYDLSYITVAITDKDGLQVPKSDNKIRFEVSGAGEIAAVDNGDATDLTSFQSHEYKAFNGLALVIVRSKKGVAGKITIRATADGLRGSEVTIESK